MCENEQKLELEPKPWKGELRSQSHTHQNQELRSWSHVHDKKSSGAGAASFLRRFRSREIIYSDPVPGQKYTIQTKIQQINCFSNNLQQLSQLIKKLQETNKS